MKAGSNTFYAKHTKRGLDILCSMTALIIFSPLFLVLTITGAIKMKGNPFFVQERPGKDEKLFKLIKFRTMSNEKDLDGDFLPVKRRLNNYGTILRSTSLDELPEAINILKGDMSLIGPRPLAVRYLPYYTEEERRRHSVRPGLSGLAQVNGRNNCPWDKRFQYDLTYIDNMSFKTDIKIVLDTIKVTLGKKDIMIGESEFLEDLDIERKKNEV